MSNEIWKPIEAVPGYSISSLGRVRNDSTGRIRSVAPNKWGQPMVKLFREGKELMRTVATLVANAFLPPPPHPSNCLDYIDGNRGNVKASNLTWRPRAEFSSESGSAYCQKLTPEQVTYIRRVYANGLTTQRQLATLFGVHQTTIGAITSGETWREYVDSAQEYESLACRVTTHARNSKADDPDTIA